MKTAAIVLAGSIGAVSAAATAAPCQDDPDVTAELCKSGFSVYLDNDVLLYDQAEDEDRNYTMGLSFQFSGRWIQTRGLAKPLNWLDALPPFAALQPKYAAATSRSHTMEFGNVAFTPDELRLARPIPNDRPYASLLFLDTRWQAVAPGSAPGEEPRNAFTSELSIGVLGLSISERFQRWLHRELQDSPTQPPYPPRGWGNQISDGGEPTARYTMRWQYAAFQRDHFDWQVIGEGNLGYHTNLGGGTVVRMGWIASPWWEFEPTPIEQGKAVPAAMPGAAEISDSRRISKARAAHGAGCDNRSGRDFELFGWAGSMVRAWGYNVLLQGQFRESAVTVDSSDVERLVYDYSAGVTAGTCLGDNWHRLTVSYARRSPEFDGPMRRYHSWGGIYYSIAF